MRSTLPLLGLATFTTAHTVFSNLYINGVNQGDGTCIRMPKDPQTASHWIEDPYSSPDMACGRDGATPVAFTCPAPAGSSLTLEFRISPDLSPTNPPPSRKSTDLGPLDPSHKGPLAVYLKPLASASSPATGPGWFKIWHAGLDPSSGTFATSKLIAQGGLLSVALPGDLPTGLYLVRPEVLALHTVEGGRVQPQFYAGCAQIYVKNDGAAALRVPGDKGVSIPGHVRPDDAGVNFNIYEEKLVGGRYVVPGPGVFFPGTPGGVVGAKEVGAPYRADGKTCLIKNANWCGVEVPRWTTEEGCWASVKQCWEQAEACYKEMGPVGGANCDVWGESKCKAMGEEECRVGEGERAGKTWEGPRKRVLTEVFLDERGAPPVGNVDEGGVKTGSVAGGAKPVVSAAPTMGFVTSVVPVATPGITDVPAVEETTSHTTNTSTKTTTVTVPGGDAAPTAVKAAPARPTGVFVPGGLPHKALATGTPSKPCGKGKGKGKFGGQGRFRRAA
ncbi:glycosyl hydrolase family 61-domain-containing protein [Schizothecium vesticola]|uniref:lytic cellulose monooxygenase (C4-dehydrogenating) n=1 Tax=Schizothecium vesticola TaxID=314040 RepID=A0AA40K5H1_9PEZI|nr:glycosyl hydrolase family 61-domain-containing protein [Schizothecium vesticola]